MQRMWTRDMGWYVRVTIVSSGDVVGLVNCGECGQRLTKCSDGSATQGRQKNRT